MNSSAVSHNQADTASYWVCAAWLPTNHILFQLANVFLLLSYLAPGGHYGLLYLRVCLTMGSFLFALWGYVILCAFDTMLWNAIFTFVNLGLTMLIVKGFLPMKYTPDMDKVYTKLFQPQNVSRDQFLAVLRCDRQILELKPKEHYTVETKTGSDRLTLVLSGSLELSQHRRNLHVVSQLEFLDSLEWFEVCSPQQYHVTMTALEACRLLLWSRSKLKAVISSDPCLRAAFENITGKDVVKKLFAFRASSWSSPKLLDSGTDTSRLQSASKDMNTAMPV
ncbi:blood vessel epicardial substance-B-like [Ornithodoros turicata]|uniref:blood vessel epicardial substance-B-like n=1 Tax=Ornithodoros turicata TaxID=34597 RepID=UPI0031390911